MPSVVRLLAALALSLGACIPVAHAEDGVIQLYLRAHITIAPDGSLRDLEWGRERTIPAAVGTKLEERIRSWTFEPGKLDGVPAETDTTLRLRLTAMPVGDGGQAYQIRFDNAETGPSMDPLRPPNYPVDAIRGGAEGQLLAELQVAADGTRQVSLTQYAGRDRYRKAFARAAEDVLDTVDVQPERVGGIEVAARFAIPMSFCLNAGCDDVFSPPADEGSSLPTTAPGLPVPQGSVARIVTEVAGTAI